MFNVISCMLVTSIMINVEKLAVQAIAVRFHRAAFHDRIKSANFESDLINRLNRESRRILKLRQRIIHEAEVAAVRSMRARSASKVHKKRSSALGGEHTSVDDAAKEQRMPSSFMQVKSRRVCRVLHGIIITHRSCFLSVETWRSYG